jgi:hypothetical protein
LLSFWIGCLFSMSLDGSGMYTFSGVKGLHVLKWLRCPLFILFKRTSHWFTWPFLMYNSENLSNTARLEFSFCFTCRCETTCGKKTWRSVQFRQLVPYKWADMGQKTTAVLVLLFWWDMNSHIGLVYNPHEAV